MYRPTNKEAAYYKRLSDAERHTVQDSDGSKFSLAGHDGHFASWFGIVRDITTDDTGHVTGLLIENKYFNDLSDGHIQTVSFMGGGDFRVRLRSNSKHLLPLTLVRVYGTVRGEDNGLPVVEAAYIRIWHWFQFNFMDYGQDHSNPQWRKNLKWKGLRIYSSRVSLDYYIERLGPTKLQLERIEEFHLGTKKTRAVSSREPPSSAAADAAVTSKTLEDRLFDAVGDQQSDEVEALLKQGAKVEARDEYFRTPLIAAAACGATVSEEMLKEFNTPQMVATAYGDTNTVRVLLKAGADVNAADDYKSALSEAVAKGKAAVVRQLLAAKANVNLKWGYRGQTALHEAATYGRVEIIELLLAAGASTSVQDDGLSTPLHAAASGNKPDAVRCLLKHGCRVNVRDKWGKTPLQVAVQRKSTDVIKALLEAGADINATAGSWTTLICATINGNADAVRFLVQTHPDLLNKTDSAGWTALMHAKSDGKKEAAQILKQAGGKEHNCLSYAAAIGDRAAIKAFLAGTGAERPSRKELDAALFKAMSQLNVGLVKQLLAHGADPNAGLEDEDGWTPFFVLCVYSGMEKRQSERAEIARLMLAAGAKANSAAKNGHTALMGAAAHLPTPIVSELIAKGACVNATTDNGGTAFTFAAEEKRYENMKLLLKHGADINAGKPSDNPVLLRSAGLLVDVKLLKFLLDHGADPNTRGRHGKTALMEAAENGHVEAVKLLLAHGANVSARADYDCNNTALKLAERERTPEIVTLLRSAISSSRK